jgi:hypothetical protein
METANKLVKRDGIFPVQLCFAIPDRNGYDITSVTAGLWGSGYVNHQTRRGRGLDVVGHAADHDQNYQHNPEDTVQCHSLQ